MHRIDLWTEPGWCVVTISPKPQPTARTARALAPDAARGFALLFIAIANLTVYLYGNEAGILGRPIDGSAGDRVADVVGALFIDNRSYPLFSLLFAYGMHQLLSREQQRGTPWPQARSLLLRRNLWLLVFGIAHGFLLFMGDIMHVYALAGFLLVLLVRAPNWVLWTVFGVTTPLMIFLGANDAFLASGFDFGMGPMMPSAQAETLGEAQLDRLGEFSGSLLFSPVLAISLMAPMMLGLLMARSQLLERPWEHRRAALIIAVVGVLSAVLGGLPFAFGLAFGFTPGPEWLGAGMLHTASGLLGGAGYAAMFALIVSRRQWAGVAPGPAIGALTALGKRSMSGYLAQSVVFVLIMPAWSLGLGGTLGTGGALLVGTSTWLVTVIGAVLLERAGKAGPAEWAIRRLAYGRPTVSATTALHH